MRIVKTIVAPTSGERIVGISPEIAPDVAPSARRRLNLFTGRTLTEQALQTEQNGRSLQMSTWSRTVAPGVVSGLEIDVDSTTLFLSSGTGLSAQGEDVTVPRPVQTPLKTLRVDSSGVINGDGTGPTFAKYRDKGHDVLPAIVVLKPVVVERRREADDVENPVNAVGSSTGTTVASHCDDDPSAHAFEDWQLVDAVQVVLYLWPTAHLPLPERDLMSRPDLWRNHLAWSIFEAERDLPSDLELPWHSAGLPVGLIGFSGVWKPTFADRNSVVRQGGGARRRSALVVWHSADAESNEVPANALLPNRAGTQHLYHAQLTQFSEHVVDLRRSPNPTALNKAFAFVPPAGLLPATVATLARGIRSHACTNHFFPRDYQVDFAPVPTEQLDTVMRRSLSLERFDFGTPDHVRILVPVPQGVYEPDLLRVEEIDGVFDTRVSGFEQLRDVELRRRYVGRAILGTLYKSITGQQWTSSADDAAVLTGGEPHPANIDLREHAEAAKDEEERWKDEFDTPGDVDNSSLVSSRVELLREKLQANGLVKAGGYQVALKFDPSRPVVKPLVWNQQTKVLSAPGTLSEDDIRRLKDEVRSVAFPRPDRAESSDEKAAREEWHDALLLLLLSANVDDLVSLESAGLTAFVERLQEIVNAANDAVDLGFTRTQTDIYRIRQLMLGSAEATRLATSPVLAEIAKGETAIGTRQDISEFVARLKKQFNAEQAEGEGDAGAKPDRRSLAAEFSFSAKPVTGVSHVPQQSGGSSKAEATGLAGVFGRNTGKRGTGPTSIADELDLVRKGSTARLAKRRKELTRAVASQAHITGKSELFRTTTVAQRLDNPEAIEAKNAAAASMYEALRSLSGLQLFLADIPVSGLADFVATADGIAPRTVPASPEPGKPFVFARVTQTLGQLLINNNELMDRVLQDPSPDDGDEAAFFSAAIELLEHTTALFRRVEGRINQYQTAIDLCREALGEMSEQVERIQRRLNEVDDSLAEARHDLNVAIALRAEEQERIDGVNERRQSILDEHVRFLAYQRPRMADLTMPLPVRPLEPGLYESPLRHCQTRQFDLPEELDGMGEILRETPIKCFPAMSRLLRSRFNRVHMLRSLIQWAQVADEVKQRAPRAWQSSRERLASIVSDIVEARRERNRQRRASAYHRAQRLPDRMTWLNLVAMAEDEVSVGDLIDTASGSAIARHVAEFLDRIMNVAGCLYERFGEVKPAVRLDWADDLSEFDEPPNLRNLTALQGWGRVPSLERRAMQELTDYLFNQLDATESEGVDLMNDMVRVCVLLASHAPVKEIITGTIDDLPDGVDASIVHDQPVTLRTNPLKVRVGMGVELPRQDGGRRVRGVVEDMAGDRVTARFHVIDGPVRVTNNERFHFRRTVTR